MTWLILKFQPYTYYAYWRDEKGMSFVKNFDGVFWTILQRTAVMCLPSTYTRQISTWQLTYKIFVPKMFSADLQIYRSAAKEAQKGQDLRELT